MKDYDIAKTSGQCSKCERQLAPGEEFVATVVEADEEFVRCDFCTRCWASCGDEQGPGVFGVWRAQAARPEEKKKLFVDDELLINFFERLAGAAEPAKINFRFVLALILMRKKLLVYDGAVKSPDGSDLWQTHFKGSGEAVEVTDPHMDEEKIADVSRSLGEILEGEL